jgi:acetyl esterase/lipase
MVSAAAKAIIDQMRANMGAPLMTLEEERTGWAEYASKEKILEGTLVSGVSLNDVPCEWVQREDSDQRVVLLIHGGGFSSGSPRIHRRFASMFAKASGHRILVPDYRLAPEEPYPAAIDDLVAVYAALVEDGIEPADVTFAGDSAGGALVVSAALKLRELGAPQPAGLILMSPWLDLTLSGESLKRNASHPNPSFAELDRAAGWYAGGADRADPLMSPVFADLKGLAPLLIQVGSHDVLLDDALRLAERGRRGGVPVTLSVAEGMWHVYQQSDCPEGWAAVEEAAAFVNNAGAAGAAV